MSITKPTWVQRIWAGLAAGGDVVEPPDVLKDAGWTATSAAPPYQYVNWLLNKVHAISRYLASRGIPDYDSGETYIAGDVVQWSVTLGGDGGIYYVPDGVTSFSNQAPSNASYWNRLSKRRDTVFGLGESDGTISADTTISVPTHYRNLTVNASVTLTLKAPLFVSGTLTVLGNIVNNGAAAVGSSYGAGDDGGGSAWTGTVRSGTRGGNGGDTATHNGLPGGDFVAAWRNHAGTGTDPFLVPGVGVYGGGLGGNGADVVGSAGGVKGANGNTIPAGIDSFREEVTSDIPGMCFCAVNGVLGLYPFAGGTGGGGGACDATGYGGGGGAGGGVVAIAARRINVGTGAFFRALGGAGASGIGSGLGGGGGGGGVVNIIVHDVWAEDVGTPGTFVKQTTRTDKRLALSGACNVSGGAAGTGGFAGGDGKVILRVIP